MPLWQGLGSADIRVPGDGFEPKTVAGGDKGFVLAGRNVNFGFVFYASHDGRTWSDVTPPELEAMGSVVSDGHTIYGLGVLESSYEFVVYRYLGDGRWSVPARLPWTPSDPDDATWLRSSWHFESNWTIEAGPEGVHVAAFTDHSGEVRLWSAADGHSFTATNVRLKDGPLGDFTLTAVPTSIGTAFVSATFGMVLRVGAGGQTPVGIVNALPSNAIIAFARRNGDRLVVQGDLHHRRKEGEPGFVAGEDPTGENDFYTPALWCADIREPVATPRLVEARVDPGRLPDLGVDPLYLPATVVPYRGGFLMAGRTLDHVDGATGIGGVWVSEDGCRWSKDQVRSNGFHEVDNLVGVAASGGATVLLGKQTVDRSVVPRIWLGS